MGIELIDIIPPIGGGYLTLEAAEALAATLPAAMLRAWAGAEEMQRLAALAAASIDVDGAMRYQGRRLEEGQEREFPRVADGRVVDVDDAGVAVVPRSVLLAVLHQANSLLAGDREERLDARHDGVVQHGADGLSEAYGGVRHVLCRRAHELMVRYELRSGSYR